MANCLIFLVFVSFLQVHFQRQKNATSVTETTDPPEDSVTVTKNVFISYYCSCFSNMLVTCMLLTGQNVILVLTNE